MCEGQGECGMSKGSVGGARGVWVVPGVWGGGECLKGSRNYERERLKRTCIHTK